MRGAHFRGGCLFFSAAAAASIACSTGSSGSSGGATLPEADAATALPDAAGSSGSSGSSGGPSFGDASPNDGASVDGKPPVPNLVANGDFTQGNVLFGSDYAFATTNTAEGQYTVGINGQAFNGLLVAAGDHTAGSGLMFIGNGKATPDRVWYSSSAIAVSANTQYYFEAWVMNLCCASGLGDGVHPVGPSQLSFFANDVLIATRTSAKLGVWEGLSTVWQSGTATTVTLKLVNANTEAAGNDFAVDDVFLGIESSVNPPK